MADVKLCLRKLIITPRDGKPFLLIQVEVALPDVEVAFDIPGVCVATLARHLAAIRDQHPELCGVVGTVVDQVDWASTVDTDKARFN